MRMGPDAATIAAQLILQPIDPNGLPFLRSGAVIGCRRLYPRRLGGHEDRGSSPASAILRPHLLEPAGPLQGPANGWFSNAISDSLSHLHVVVVHLTAALALVADNIHSRSSKNAARENLFSTHSRRVPPGSPLGRIYRELALGTEG